MKNGPAASVSLKVFQEREIKACRDKGDCCQCGVCCVAFLVENVPVPKAIYDGVEDTRHTVHTTFTKQAGEPCPHLKPNKSGTFDCDLHGKPEQPDVCRTWKGNELGNHGMTQYGQLLSAVHVSMMGANGAKAIRNLQPFMRSKALALFRGSPYIQNPDRRGGFEQTHHLTAFLRNLLIELGQYDAELCAALRIRQSLVRAERAEPGWIKNMIRRLRLDFANPVHAEFIRDCVPEHAMR